MHKMIFTDLTTTYTRVSKRTARKLWGTEDLAFCACHLRPGYPWAPHCVISAQDIKARLASIYDFVKREADFDLMVKQFESYNCTGAEAGTYTAFYTLTPRTGEKPCMPKMAP